MYRNEVIAALFGRIGFRKPLQPEYANILSADNQQSRSGLYFDGFHASVNIANMMEVVNPEPTISDNDFNTFLSDFQKDAIATVLDGIFSNVEVIEQQMVFERDDLRPQILPNTGKFVGYELQVVNRTNVSVKMHALSMFFKGSGTFNVYLFNHLSTQPIKTFSVTVVDGEELILPIDDVILSAISTTNKSRTFFLGYFQDDIESQGIQAYDFPRLHRTAICYSATGMQADVIGNSFDRFRPIHTYRTYGINIELSSEYDYTEVILRNQSVFDKAVGLQMAAKVIEGIIHSTRSNKNERIGQEGVQRLYNDLNLDMQTPELPYSSGIKNQLRRELKRLYDNFFPKAKSTVNTSPLCYIPNPPLLG